MGKVFSTELLNVMRQLAHLEFVNELVEELLCAPNSPTFYMWYKGEYYIGGLEEKQFPPRDAVVVHKDVWGKDSEVPSRLS